MAMAVLLVEGAGEGVAISPTMADDLARLGVTDVAICRDRETVAIILEGWAFDASTADAATRSLIPTARARRVLLPAMRLALSDHHGPRLGDDETMRAPSLPGSTSSPGPTGPRRAGGADGP
jgi:hypothetical protein